MKIRLSLYLSLLLLVSCKDSARNESPVRNVDVANEFIDAFYSFNSDTLQTILSDAGESGPEILFYQKWAECGHYKVLDRDHYAERNDSIVVFPVTVKDDLMSALKIDFNVTDTFKIVIRDGRIRSIQTSSNDPEKYHEAKDWVKKNRPELIEKPCADSPCECIQGMLKGFAEFIEKK